jgi:glycerol-3-phosphate acyltransferase PlsX
MEDKATITLKEKKDSSICVAAKLVFDGLASGFVSMGHTGAIMVASMKIMGTLPGVDRPCLASVMPNINGHPTVLLDVGANLECKPENIAQFAVMGSVYAEQVLGISKPRVGVLSVGEEDSKGSTIIKEATSSLRDLDLNFLGNAEGCDIWNGKFDVIACDGFVGNAILKSSETLAESLLHGLKSTFMESRHARLSGFLSINAISKLKKKLDYSEYGGAPLLGVKGITIIGHGRSNAYAIKNAICAAVKASEHAINQRIQQSLTGILFKRR